MHTPATTTEAKPPSKPTEKPVANSEPAADATTDATDDAEEGFQRASLPEPRASFFSRLFFIWVFDLVIRGWRNPLHDENLWEMRDDERGAATAATLRHNWLAAKQRKEKKSPLWNALLNSNRRPLTILFFLKIIDMTMTVLQPVFVSQLLRVLEDPRRPIRDGLLWSIALFLAPVIKSLNDNQFFLLALRMSMRVRSSLQALLYRKSLSISPAARAASSLGEIVNLMQLDTQRIGDFFQFAQVLVSAPVLIIVTVGLLYHYIGPSAIIGLVVTLLMVPLQAILITTMAKLRKAGLHITDRRVKLMNEILQGIKAVKFYAWEVPFAAAVEDSRKEELQKFSKTINTRAATLAIMMSIPLVIGVITFAFFAGVFKNELLPSRVFTGIALLNQLRIPVMILPMTISALIDARLGVKRIQRFLDLQDTENYSREEGSACKMAGEDDQGEGALGKESTSKAVVESNVSSSDVSTARYASISITNGEFEWFQIASNPLEIPPKKKKKFCLPLRKRNRAVAETDSDGNASAEQNSAENVGPQDRSSAGTAEEEGASDGSRFTAARGSALHDINVSLAAPELAAIVGHVGSGKSSLFHAILGEMNKLGGQVRLQGSVAYVAQTAWIFNDTLRNNILFGEPYDEEAYQRAIDVSELAHDIEILPSGDLTAIGEKGINLSGGQKQRVSIARAVYADADVYMFDDPLSALDAHVSRKVFEKCISSRGALKDKLRLLITNQTQVLPECDKIVFLHRGGIRGAGNFAELSTDPAFRSLISQQESGSPEEENKEVEGPDATVVDGNKGQGKNDPAPNNTAGRSLIESEERKTGNVTFKTYYDYAMACGGWIQFLGILLFWVSVTVLSLIVQWWLSYWSEQEFRARSDTNVDPRSLWFYLGIYFALTVAYVVSTYLRSVWYLNAALHASKTMHKKMLGSVLRAPLTFFDTTPIGRILSRFSRDVSVLDELLPRFFQQMMVSTLQLVLSYAFIGAILPLFFVAATPITIFYFLLQRFFNRTSLELKRLDSISKSPIYAHFSETLGGLSTLRAYSKQEQSISDNMDKIDINQRAFFSWLLASRWFSLYLELAGSVLIFCTAIFGVLAREQKFAGSVGLVLTYALQVTAMLGFSVRSITELEGQMNSVERTNYYGRDLPQEAAAEVEPELDEDWPIEGKIVMSDVEMRYREGLPLILKGVNVVVNGGEKVGVVGRTGSGKSSLMIALLRMVEVEQGSILVDGQDLKALGLNDVRKRITIIPQDPVMFSGTIRLNLDPFGEHSDAELWDALEKSHMKQFVSEFEEGLEAKVSEYGENLSAGQRQIICLTRALLRSSKILILDEASSSLDMETDRLLQETIRTNFKHATILTIAHRLTTLADYDKIVVMDSGKVVEYDTPTTLLENSNGHLSGLVDAMGPAGSAHFRALVTESTRSRVAKSDSQS